jgi:hypothetical protein
MDTSEIYIWDEVEADPTLAHLHADDDVIRYLFSQPYRVIKETSHLKEIVDNVNAHYGAGRNEMDDIDWLISYHLLYAKRKTIAYDDYFDIYSDYSRESNRRRPRIRHVQEIIENSLTWHKYNFQLSLQKSDGDFQRMMKNLSIRIKLHPKIPNSPFLYIVGFDASVVEPFTNIIDNAYPYLHRDKRVYGHTKDATRSNYIVFRTWDCNRTLSSFTPNNVNMKTVIIVPRKENVENYFTATSSPCGSDSIFHISATPTEKFFPTSKNFTLNLQFEYHFHCIATPLPGRYSVDYFEQKLKFNGAETATVEMNRALKKMNEDKLFLSRNLLHILNQISALEKICIEYLDHDYTLSLTFNP